MRTTKRKQIRIGDVYRFRAINKSTDVIGVYNWLAGDDYIVVNLRYTKNIDNMLYYKKTYNYDSEEQLVKVIKEINKDIKEWNYEQSV